MSGVTRGAVLDACGAPDALLAFQQWCFRVPGVQAAVLHDDGVVSSAAYGVLARNERFKYSNIGYSLLGQVIEAVEP